MRRAVLALSTRSWILLALGWVGVSGAMAQACDCKDVVDLQARYCQARAAVQEWDRLIAWSTGRVELRQKVERYTITGKVDVAQCVNEAIGMVNDTFTGNSGRWIEAPAVGGETSNANCGVKIDAPSACLREVLGKHEQVHQHACQGVKGGDPTGGKDFGYVQNFLVRNVNWRLAYSLTSYMVEERAGYSTEMAEILKRLEDLAKRCADKTPFERQTPKGKVFSLTPCPNPDPETYRHKRKCQRM